MNGKEARLREIIRGTGGLAVAYSGGVDSALVLAVAAAELGDRALGIMGVSPSLAAGEREHALATAGEIGARVEEVHPAEFSDPEYVANPPDRCYFCKRSLLKEVLDLARRRGFTKVADGFNADDWTDIRPGQQAAREAGVLSPLAQAGLGKEEIRVLARALGLRVWNRPATPCLSSRIPYGTPVSVEVLARISSAEKAVRGLVPGAVDVRVRHFGTRAVIQVDAACVPEITGRRAELDSALAEFGYLEVDIDPAGYRRGFLNGPVKAPA
jgi:uncharacterized protein